MKKHGLYWQKVVFLLPADTSDLEKSVLADTLEISPDFLNGMTAVGEKLPAVLKTTKNRKGVDVVTFKEQGVFAHGWMKNATAKDWKMINDAIATGSSFRLAELTEFHVIRLDFFVKESPGKCGEYIRNVPYNGERLTHANVALQAEDKDSDNWDLNSVPVLLSLE